LRGLCKNKNNSKRGEFSMAQKSTPILIPLRLKPGDRVRLVSPASTPSKEHLDKTVATLEKLGLQVEISKHAMDEYGYLAGKDEDRLSDINDALRDSGIKAIIATRGGKGAYRIADGLDFEAARKYPKLLIGFSEITILHLALWKHCRLTAIHGAAWDESFGKETAESFRKAVMTTEPVIIKSNPDEPTAALTISGKVSGILLGGNQDMIAIAAGWMLPSFEGAILLLEAVDMRLGMIDRQLTMLQNAGHLKGIKGVIVGQYFKCGPDATTQGEWTAIDVLRDRLAKFNVPILGGLPIGHGEHPVAVPLGTMATLDADKGILTVEAGVR
jgi:muramoyltetrapeptide carboxypeptidase